MSHHGCEVFIKLHLYFSSAIYLVKSDKKSGTVVASAPPISVDIENKRLQKDISPTFYCTVFRVRD